MSENIKKYKTLYQAKEDQHLKDLFEFLSFKSISTDPEYSSEINKCAKWVETYLKDSGLEVEFWETEGYPVVYAEYVAGPDKPTLLIYNHYDVQPVDPLDLWDADPFEPKIGDDGQIYARGATDNKGQAFFVWAAIREMLASNGELPINIKLFVEGEEESGSGSMPQVLESKKSKLKADYVLIVDVGVHSLDRPSVIIGTRGIVAMELRLKASNTDLHSGVFGGIAYNPNHALVSILSSLRDENGKIAVPGFYDGVTELSDKQRSALDFTYDESEFEEMLGMKSNGGENNFSALESAWLRPTLEINGISGGYAGEGFKTVIPAEATAKISCRTVPGQKTTDLYEKINNFISSQIPSGMTHQLILIQGYGEAAMSSPDSKIIKLSQKAMEEVSGKDCSLVLEGATIPIGPDLAKAAEAELAFLGFILPGDQMHAPNEHFGKDRVELGFATIARLIELIAEE